MVKNNVPFPAEYNLLWDYIRKHWDAIDYFTRLKAWEKQSNRMMPGANAILLLVRFDPLNLQLEFAGLIV